MPESAVIPESTSRVERRRAQNRRALVAAARRLFAEHGFEATTIAGIAAAADLGFGTFYRYFADKEAILEAVLDEGRVAFSEVLSHPENEEAPPAAALGGLSARFAKAVRRNLDVFRLMWQVGIRDEAGAERLRLDQLPPERSLPVLLGGVIERIIDRGVASGAFPPADAALLSRFIASAHMYLFSPTTLEFSEETLIESLCEFELNALGVGGRKHDSRGNGGRSG